MYYDRITRIYLSYPVIYYKKPVKNEIFKVIRNTFKPVYEVFDPAKVKSHRYMDVYLEEVRKSDIVIYIPIHIYMTAGVVEEVYHGLKHGKKIYRYVDGRPIEIKDEKDIDEHPLDIETTRKLYQILKYLDLPLLKSEIDRLIHLEDYLPSHAIEEIHKNLDKYKPKGINLPPEKRWLHWWENYEGYKHEIEAERIFRYVLDWIDYYGVTEDELKEARKRSITNKVQIPIRDIMQFCDLSGIPYYILDEILGYPFDLSEPRYHRLAVHVLNEGHIRKEKGRKSTYYIFYYNQEPVLHKLVRDIGGYPSTEDKRYNVKVTRVDRKYVSPLLKLGVPLGHKGKNIPTYELKYLDEETFKYYVQSLLTEEGNLYVEIQRDRWISLELSWTRFIDLTKDLEDPYKYIKKFGYGSLSTKKVLENSPEIFLIAGLKGNPYLEYEAKEISRRLDIPIDKIKLRINRFYISKRDDGIRASWQAHILDNKYVIKVLKEVGFIPGSFKDHYSKMILKLYHEYEKGDRREEVIEKIKELEKHKEEMFKKWIKNRKI